MELRLRHKDGSWRHVETTCTSLLEDPAVEGVVFNTRDITERKQAEERLREREERFRLLAENAPDVVFRYRLKPTPGFEYVSSSITAMIGYTPEEHYADPEIIDKVVHPDDRHIIEQALRRPEESIALRWLRKDGEIVWTDQRNKPIYDEAGELVAIEGIIRDITERKRIEQEIAELSQRNELILDSAGEGILGFDNEGRITFINPAAAKILGWEVEELIGRQGHPAMHHTKPDGTPYPWEECPIHNSIKEGVSREVGDEVYLAQGRDELLCTVH